jgi:hypothetical protein
MPKGQGSKQPLFIDVSVLRVEKWRNAAHTERMCGNQKRVKHGQDGKRRHNKRGQIDRARDGIIVSRREERRGEKR